MFVLLLSSGLLFGQPTYVLWCQLFPLSLIVSNICSNLQYHQWLQTCHPTGLQAKPYWAEITIGCAVIGFVDGNLGKKKRMYVESTCGVDVPA